MIFARLKGLKYEHIKKTKGIEEATEYAAKSIYYFCILNNNDTI